MRILVVSSSYPPRGWGGAEVAAEGIANWMAAHGHQIAIYTDSRAPNPLSPTIKRYVPHKGWWTHRAEEHAKKGRLRKAIWHLMDHIPRRGFSEFAKTVLDFRPDLVMVHLAPGLGIGVFEYCASRDLPVIFVMHDFWVTCLRSSMFSKAGTACTQRELLCRWSSTIRWHALSKVRRLGVWAPSRKVLELSVEQMGNVFGNVLVERNIVDFSDFRRTSGYAGDAAIRFLYVGKVTVAKGVAFVVECLASLPPGLEFEMDVIGTGDAEEKLKRAYAGDKRFRFRGLCARAEVVRYYHSATVLLVPSVWFEPAGLVIYQAQEAGLPVIASDSGGMPELLAGRADSIVIPAGNCLKWTSRLRAVIEDRMFREQLKSAAIQLASKCESATDARATRVVDFCTSIINSVPAAART